MKKYQYNNEGYPVLISEKLKNILIDYLGIEEEDINEHARLDQDLGCDSLDCVELIMEIEHEYGIPIPDDKAMKCYTVGDIAKLIKELTD